MLKSRRRLTDSDLKEWLKIPIFSVSLIGSGCGVAIFLFHDYEIADMLIITILAFLASDIVSSRIVRGGGGILQICLFGVRAQPKGYGVIAFFIAIIFSAIVVNGATQWIVSIISLHYSDLIMDLCIGLILASLVYLDMKTKFYAHSKTK